LNWLFPERVGKKYKAKYCVPLNGEYVVDIDSYMMLFKHDHKLDQPVDYIGIGDFIDFIETKTGASRLTPEEKEIKEKLTV